MANLDLASIHMAAEMGCRGKLGGWIIQGALPLNANYYTRAGVPLLIKLAAAQLDPKTEKQQAQRLLVGHATRDWQIAGQVERSRAADIARRRNLPLFHAYLSLRIKELQAMPTIDDIPGLRNALDGLAAEIAALTAQITDTPDYEPLTLLNGWSNNPWGVPNAAYSRSFDGLVSLRGLIVPGDRSANIKIATLPVGYRPSGYMHIPAATDTGYTAGQAAVVVLHPNGDVFINQSQNCAWVSLAGVNFRAG